MANTLERSAGGPGWAHGRIGNVVFLDYRTDVPADAVAHSFELITRTIAQHSRGIVLIAIFGEQTRVPTAALRRSIAAFLETRRAQLLLGCTVIEGDSVAAIIKRAAVTMMTTLLKPSYPHRTTRTVPVACDLSAPRASDDSGAALSQGSLFAAFAALRAPTVGSQRSS